MKVLVLSNSFATCLRHDYTVRKFPMSGVIAGARNCPIGSVELVNLLARIGEK
jgi:hypothetical protein